MIGKILSNRNQQNVRNCCMSVSNFRQKEWRGANKLYIMAATINWTTKKWAGGIHQTPKKTYQHYGQKKKVLRSFCVTDIGLMDNGRISAYTITVSCTGTHLHLTDPEPEVGENPLSNTARVTSTLPVYLPCTFPGNHLLTIPKGILNSWISCTLTSHVKTHTNPAMHTHSHGR